MGRAQSITAARGVSSAYIAAVSVEYIVSEREVGVIEGRCTIIGVARTISCFGATLAPDNPSLDPLSLTPRYATRYIRVGGWGPWRPSGTR